MHPPVAGSLVRRTEVVPGRSIDRTLHASGLASFTERAPHAAAAGDGRGPLVSWRCAALRAVPQIKLVECNPCVDIRRAEFEKAALRMERLLLGPFSILIASAFVIGSCVAVSELSHALGLRLAAGGRRLRARLSRDRRRGTTP